MSIPNGFLPTRNKVDSASTYPESTTFSYSKMLDRYNRKEKTKMIIGYTLFLATIFIITGLLITVVAVYCANVSLYY